MSRAADTLIERSEPTPVARVGSILLLHVLYSWNL
jgi:hypothetical protein